MFEWLPLMTFDIDPFKTSKNHNIFKSAKISHGDFITRCSELGYSLDNDSLDDGDPFNGVINSEYRDINDFINPNSNPSTNFSVCHLNIASLDLHIEDLRLTLAQAKHKFNVIVIPYISYMVKP